MMRLKLNLQIATQASDFPTKNQFKQWIHAALNEKLEQTEITIRLVDEIESAKLNFNYRRKRGPTNILAFPFQATRSAKAILLGDLVICVPVVIREASEQKKAAQAHWTHLTIHGSLHLLGYDHIKPDEAAIMEAEEIAILAGLGLPNPYV